MLMDEPFGAIDPINRERLQNEFLRLQAELRKTIVFVTHDIDEAIKMGDKIAILKEGGQLAQFAAPAELLMYPAEKFVEDFVGADRALKRLALQRVRDIDLWKAATVRVGEPSPRRAPKLEDADLDIPLLVDDEDRPIGWLSERGLQGERVREELRSTAEPIVELDDILRDALSDLLGSDTQYGPVVDADGEVVGVLSMEVLAHALSHKAEHMPTAFGAGRPRARGRGGRVLTASIATCGLAHARRRSPSATARTPSKSARATTGCARSWIARQLRPVPAPAVGARAAQHRAAAHRLLRRHRAGDARPPLHVPERVVPGAS